MTRIAMRLVLEVGCQPKSIDINVVEGLPDGGDCVNWLAAHPSATAADVMALIAEAADEDEPVSKETAASGDSTGQAEKEIERLSKLGRLEFELQRADAAKALKMRASVLDQLVKELRDETEEDPDPFADVEPAAEAVLLADILDAARKLFTDHVIASPHAGVAVALWTAWTWVAEYTDCAPILLFKSPLKRCGKTTALSVTTNMVRRALPASSISTAATFRSIEKFSPTLVLDEADTFLPANEELRGVINAGHTRKTAFVIRTVGEDHDPQVFRVFGPKVLALIGRAPDTVEDRSVIISLQRKLKGEQVKKLADTSDDVWSSLQSNFARWSLDFGHQLRRARPAIPGSLNDREGDSWTPLLAIADLAGAEWPKLARDAAVGLSGQGEPDLDTGLLTDIRDILDGPIKSDPISSLELHAVLIKDKDRPWSTFNKGRELSQSQMSRRLSKFSIVARPVRIGIETAKGWPRKAFDDAFARYLSEITVTPTQASNGAACDGIEKRHTQDGVTDSKASQASNGAGCDAVTEISPANGTNDAIKYSSRWVIHFENQKSTEAVFGDEVDLAEVLAS